MAEETVYLIVNFEDDSADELDSVRRELEEDIRVSSVEMSPEARRLLERTGRIKRAE